MTDYRTVYGLTDEEMLELKAAYFYNDDTGDVLTGDMLPEDVPDDVIYREYAGIYFVDDDFACNSGK